MEIRGAIPTAGLADGVITVDSGFITKIEPIAGTDQTDQTDQTDGRAAGGDVLLPGLLDLHCHGGGGASFATSDPAEAAAAAAFHAARGTVGVLASLVTAAPADLLRQVRMLAGLAASGDVLGIHLEGPFLAPARRGAHDPSLLREPDPALAEALLDAGGGAIRVVTIAPELPGAAEVAAALRAAGVVVAHGHTDADYAMMTAALARAGALVTHLGNAMPPLHHRAAGPVAAALVAAAADAAWVELIADGVHVDAGFTRLVFAAAAPGRVVLVTDATAAAGMPDGSYPLGPVRVTVSGGVARLAGPGGGAIAGGTSTLLSVVGVARDSGVRLPDAVRAASETPAGVLGLGCRGRLAAGMAADIVVTDARLRVRRVLRGGRWLDRHGGYS